MKKAIGILIFGIGLITFGCKEEKSDRLEVKAYAYNKTVGNSIKAGQEE